MIGTILVSTDGSAHADAAVDLGADLAKKFDARLVLLHVAYRGGQLPTELFQKATAGFEDAEKRGDWTSDHPEWSRRHRILEFMGRTILDEAAQRARDHGAAKVETLLDYGGAGERVLHHAGHLPADMIVMGSRGFTEMEGLMLGSVSHKVFHNAPCTCVTVHHSERQGAKAAPGVVLVPTDGSDHAAKAVDIGSTVAAKSGAALVLLHVLMHGAHFDSFEKTVDLSKLDPDVRDELDPQKHPFARGAFARVLAPELSEEALEAVGWQILDKAKAAAIANGVAEPKLVVRDGTPARVILDVAREEGADLIAMGTRGMGEVGGLLAGSVSYKINHAAPCTVMVVR